MTANYSVRNLFELRGPAVERFEMWMGGVHPFLNHVHTPIQNFQNALCVVFLAQANLFAILTMSSVSAIDFFDIDQLAVVPTVLLFLRYSS